MCAARNSSSWRSSCQRRGFVIPCTGSLAFSLAVVTQPGALVARFACSSTAARTPLWPALTPLLPSTFAPAQGARCGASDPTPFGPQAWASCLVFHPIVITPVVKILDLVFGAQAAHTSPFRLDARDFLLHAHTPSPTLMLCAGRGHGSYLPARRENA
jgi:hypothetical protein